TSSSGGIVPVTLRSYSVTSLSTGANGPCSQVLTNPSGADGDSRLSVMSPPSSLGSVTWITVTLATEHHAPEGSLSLGAPNRDSPPVGRSVQDADYAGAVYRSMNRAK